MEKETIRQAAESAINDLKFECRVKAVYQPPGKESWCVQFTSNYGEFCDGFQDREGKENSAEVAREKIKRHLFRVRKPSRIRIRKRRGAPEIPQSAFPAGTINDIEGLVSRAPALIGSVVDQISHLASAVFEGGLESVVKLKDQGLAAVEPLIEKKAGKPRKKPSQKKSSQKKPTKAKNVLSKTARKTSHTAPAKARKAGGGSKKGPGSSKRK